MTQRSSPAVSGGPRSGPTLYHLADVRLGAAFPFLGEAGAAHRRLVRDTFVRAVDAGMDLQPAAVLVTGNLFGTSVPPRELLQFAREQLARFAGRAVPVLIAAGPLDPLIDRSYALGAFADLAHVTVFPAAPRAVEVADGAVTVVGISWSATPVSADFLTALARQPRQGYLVGAACLEVPEGEEALAALRRLIDASGAHYLALGNSPVRRALGSADVPALFPGAPELVAPVEGEGAPVLVEFRDGRAHATFVPVARRRFRRLELGAAAYARTDDLVAAIRALGSPDLAAVVRLTGALRPDQLFDLDHVLASARDAFLALDLEDETTLAAAEMADARFPELSAAAAFVTVARREVEQAPDPEARRIAAAALRLGLALLEGRSHP
jgi:DNA repair exonuclease SbcCD nuclease subunit